MTIVVFILVVFALFFVVKFMGVEMDDPSAKRGGPPSKTSSSLPSLVVAQAFQCSNNWVNTNNVYSCNGTSFTCPMSNTSPVASTSVPTQILCMNPNSKSVLQQFGVCKVIGLN
jgi:hypothetical protein